MTRRRRMLVILLVVLVGVPLLAAIGVGQYLVRGGLASEIEHRWSAYGLPGRLQVGSLRLVGLDEAVAENLTIQEVGQPALATVRRATIRFDPLDRRLISLRIDGVRGGLDAQRYRFLLAIIKAESKHLSARAPSPVLVEVVDGAMELPGGMQLTDVAVRVDTLGATSAVEAVGNAAGKPMKVRVATDRAGPEAPIITTVDVLEGSVAPTAILRVVEGIGLTGLIPREFDPWLPPMADFTGTRVIVDVVSDTIRGAGKVQWVGGSGSCEIDADMRRAVIRRLQVQDAKLGSLEGTLTADRAGTSVAIDAVTWNAGPGLPLPKGLPLAEVAKLMPELQIRWPTSDRRTSIALVGAGRSRLEVVLGGATPPRINAAEVPLVLVQGFLPAPLVIGGGHVVEASAVLHDGRPEFSARLSQARLLAEGWSFGPIDGMVAAVTNLQVPGGDVQVSADLPIGKLTFAGNAATGRVGVTCKAVETLIGRLRGPIGMPELSGSLSLQAGFTVSSGVIRVSVERLELADAQLRLSRRDLIRDLTARLSGTASISPALIDLDLGGHLKAGDIRIPDDWLSLAARTPIFSLDVGIRFEAGKFTELKLRRAMVRAADGAGEPTPGGFSAQLEGVVAGSLYDGRVLGIVDHADLAWLTSLVVPGQVQVGGEGAVSFQAAVTGGEIHRIDGSFLPMGADLDINRGKLKVGGITGGVNFTIGGEKKR